MLTSIALATSECVQATSLDWLAARAVVLHILAIASLFTHIILPSNIRFS
jgi:hypothetical protein